MAHFDLKIGAFSIIPLRNPTVIKNAQPTIHELLPIYRFRAFLKTPFFHIQGRIYIKQCFYSEI